MAPQLVVQSEKNKSGWLPSAFTDAPLEKGEHSFRRNGNPLAVRFSNKKEIFFLSSIHKANVIKTGKRNGAQKPHQKTAVDK